MFRRKPPEGSAPPAEPGSPPAERVGFFSRLRSRLNRGPSWLTYDLANLFRGRKIDEQILEELESRLLMADVGVEATGESGAQRAAGRRGAQSASEVPECRHPCAMREAAGDPRPAANICGPGGRC